MYPHHHLTLTELDDLKRELEAEVQFCYRNSPPDAAAVEEELDSLNGELQQRQQLVAQMLALTSS